jgi:hypothetical protein
MPGANGSLHVAYGVCSVSRTKLSFPDRGQYPAVMRMKSSADLRWRA